MAKETAISRQPLLPPLWTCPKCEHQFVTANLSHSCGRYRLDDHFVRCAPMVRKVFDAFVAIFEAFGPVTVYAQKTRIICQVRVRFAGAVTRRHSLETHLWLKRHAEHTRLRRVEFIPPDNYIHRFLFNAPEQLDMPFRRLASEAYAIGEQRHRTPPASRHA